MLRSKKINVGYNSIVLNGDKLGFTHSSGEHVDFVDIDTKEYIYLSDKYYAIWAYDYYMLGVLIMNNGDTIKFSKGRNSEKVKIIKHGVEILAYCFVQSDKDWFGGYMGTHYGDTILYRDRRDVRYRSSVYDYDVKVDKFHPEDPLSIIHIDNWYPIEVALVSNGHKYYCVVPELKIIEPVHEYIAGHPIKNNEYYQVSLKFSKDSRIPGLYGGNTMKFLMYHYSNGPWKNTKDIHFYSKEWIWENNTDQNGQDIKVRRPEYRALKNIVMGHYLDISINFQN